MIHLNPHALAVTDHQGTPAFTRERTIRPEFDYILAALVDPLNDYERNISHAPASGFIRDKVYVPNTTPEAIALFYEFSRSWTDGNGIERGRIGPQGNIIGPFMGGRRGMDPTQSGHDTPGNRIRNIQRPGRAGEVGVAGPDEFPFNDNHNFPNSWFPSHRYPFSSPDPTIARDWRSLLGDSMENLHTTINGVTVNAVADRASDTITFTGTSFEDVYNQFQIYAQEFLFHDGLPLIPPTPELVNEMLTGTSRHRDEVIGGKVPGRSGSTTVEKVAINAVMAGALPEHFPIILAAIEMFSQDNDNRQAHFHGLTSGGPFGYMLVVSGPIVEELGLHTGAGYIGGAGHSVNNTIGRATRLNTRNLGNNWLGYQDTPRLGRLHEIVHPVVAVDTASHPSGWLTYHEQMGFSRDHSVVSIHSMGNHNMIHLDSAGIDQQWDAHSLIAHLRTQNDRGTDLIIVIGPAHAQALYEAGWTNIDALRLNTPSQGLTFPNGFENGLGNNNNPLRGSGGLGGANTLNNTWIVVTGEDPTRATSYGSNSHGGGSTFATTRITGAPLSNVVNCLPVPGTPSNFTVVPGANPGEAVLTWDLPAVTAGRMPITHFEVTAQSERNDLQRWVMVPGGAEARTITLTHLDGGNNYSFRVRAVSGSYTNTNPELMYYFGGRRVPLMHGDPVVPGGTVAGVGGVTFPNVNVYTAWDENAFSTGLGTQGRELGVVPGRGAVANIHWTQFTNGNGVHATGPSEVFYITAQLNDDESSIDVQWRTPWSDGGSPITGYEFSTDNGATWLPMDNATGRDFVMPVANGASASSAGIRINGSFTITHQSELYNFAPQLLESNATYDILVRAVNAIGHGSFAGQSIALAEGTAWPFQTHHRGPNAASPGHNNLAQANNVFVQAVSLVRITIGNVPAPLEMVMTCACDVEYCICGYYCECDKYTCACEQECENYEDYEYGEEYYSYDSDRCCPYYVCCCPPFVIRGNGNGTDVDCQAGCCTDETYPDAPDSSDLQDATVKEEDNYA